nr:hypothetical protein [Candidatus Levybacteria bacterium]
MNTKIIGIIAAIVLLLGAGGAYFLNQNKTATNTNVSPTPTKAKNKTSSLLDLLNLGKNQKCTFKTATSSTTTEGTLYITTGKMRGDFKTTVNGKAEEMNMIRDGEMNYIWGSSLKTGIKMKVPLDELSKNQQTSGFINPNNKMDYNCLPWTIDSSLFTPPPDIKFTDMTSLVVPKITGTQTKTDTTNPCSQITDAAAKSACESALSGQ